MKSIPKVLNVLLSVVLIILLVIMLNQKDDLMAQIENLQKENIDLTNHVEMNNNSDLPKNSHILNLIFYNKSGIRSF